MPVKIPAIGSGDTTPTVATDDIGGQAHQLIKLEHGDPGSATPVSETNPLPTSARTPLTASAPTFATVGLASGVALVANASRKGLVLVNTSTARISLAFGVPAVLYSGVTLMPNGGSFEMDAWTFTTAEVRAIASAAGSNLTIQEWA